MTDPDINSQAQALPAYARVDAAKAAILKAAEAPEYAYVPYALWLDLEAAFCARNAEMYSEMAADMRAPEVAA